MEGRSMNLLDRKIRGFRLIDVVSLCALVGLVMSVYLAKTVAGRERAEIASVEDQIDAEKQRIRLLQAEVSHLEQPARIEQLSATHLGLKPIPASRETTPEALVEIAHQAPHS